jgi:hypothetical protein
MEHQREAAEATLPDQEAEDLAWMTPKLPGQVKWALGPSFGYRVQAELPLADPADGEATQQAALAGFEAAFLPLKGCLASAADSTAPVLNQGLPSIEDLLLFCDEAGWPAVRREPGAVKVELEVPGSMAAAHITVSPRAVRVYSDVCNFTGFSPMPRRALAQLVLRANACLRWVRGGFFKGDGLESAGFEITIAAAVDASVLAQALGALSVASRLCGREASLLADERVAALFLEVGDGVMVRQNKNNER